MNVLFVDYEWGNTRTSGVTHVTHTHTHTYIKYTHTHIYIYVCVCVRARLDQIFVVARMSN